MSLKFDIKNNIDTQNVSKTFKSNKSFWIFAAKEWKKLIDPYTPYDTGALMKTYLIRPNEIEYEVDYAKKVYYGSHLNFKKDKHFLATHAWDKHAELTQKPILINKLQIKINNQMKGENI